MSVSDFKHIFVAVLAKGYLRASNKCSRVIDPYVWFNEGDISPFILIVLTKLIHVKTFGAFLVVKSLVKIPPTNAMLPAVSSLNADVVFVERLEELNHTYIANTALKFVSVNVRQIINLIGL